AEVVGDPELRREAAGVAAAMRGGQSVPGSIRGARLFPPLLGWIIITGQAQGNLAPALRQAAQIYRRQAVHGADLLRVVLPTALLLAIGATATALYCLTLFVPFVNLMFKLAEG
ncbi:MAG TPA: type II secretion system F family protein, partial [Isosphaeraceae bacterium]